MAFDAFLKLDGVQGESPDAKHPGEIEIESFSWGLSVPIGTTTGGGSAVSGRPTFQDFSFTADVSSASPVLFAYATQGKHIKEGVITLRSSGGNGGNEYYVVKLSDLLVSSYNQAASTAGDRPVDQFSINYSQIHISYKPQEDDGTLGDAIEAQYDLRTLKS